MPIRSHVLEAYLLRPPAPSGARCAAPRRAGPAASALPGFLLSRTRVSVRRNACAAERGVARRGGCRAQHHVALRGFGPARGCERAGGWVHRRLPERDPRASLDGRARDDGEDLGRALVSHLVRTAQCRRQRHGRTLGMVARYSVGCASSAACCMFMLHVASGPLLLHGSLKAADAITKRKRRRMTYLRSLCVCLLGLSGTSQGLRGRVLRARRFSAHVIRRCHRPRQAPKPMLHLACLALHLACLTLHLACLTLPTSQCPAASGTASKSLCEGCSPRLLSATMPAHTHVGLVVDSVTFSHRRATGCSEYSHSQDRGRVFVCFQEDGNGPLLPSNPDGRESLAAHQPLVRHRRHAHSTRTHARTLTKPRTPAHAPSAGVRGFRPQGSSSRLSV